MLYFFLSHAAGNDDYLRRFHRDLSAEVRALAGVDGEVGYLSTTSRTTGQGWPTTAERAIQTCRTFVALCSPQYFQSEISGREWSVFADRLDRHQRETGILSDALIPIVWDSGGAGRDALAAPGATLAPPSPGGAGVHRLIRLRSWRNEYLAFLSSLARRIVAAAEAGPVGSSDAGPGLATARNAFDISGQDGTAATWIQLDTPAASSAQRVHFVIATGTREEMAAVRNDIRYYGASRREWAPYRPALPEPLVTRARSVAAEHRFGSDVVDLERLPEQIAQAHQNNDIVVLLVDAWATRIGEYRQALTDYDSGAESAVAVLVPASRDDAETARHRSELRSELNNVFLHTSSCHDPMFRSEIETAAEFEDDLESALEAARNRIYRTGRVFRQPSNRSASERPILEGP